MLSGLLNGVYAIQGRVRDQVVNVTILGGYHAPDGSERGLNLGFELVDALVVAPVIRLGVVLLQGGVRQSAGSATSRVCLVLDGWRCPRSRHEP